MVMIYNNYDQQVALAKSNNRSVVNFDNNPPPVQPISAEKDTLTLSDKALAMMNGKATTAQSAPTYIKPQTASSLLAQNDSSNSEQSNAVKDNRFSDMMQSILDQRLGIDRDKLAELEAMMEDVGKNKTMSPEEKEKALEALEKIREKIIEESIDIRETSKQFNDES